MLLQFYCSCILAILALSTVLCTKDYSGYRLVQFKRSETNIRGRLPESEDVKYFSARTLLVSEDAFRNLTDIGVEFDVLNDNIQKDLDKEKAAETKTRSFRRFGSRRDTDAIFQSFPRHEQINNYITQLASSNPSLASIRSVGRSFEGRDMKLITIGGGRSKPIIWIDAGIHAREWASPVSALYIARELVSNYNTDQSVRKLVDSFEWQILPSANPDGYEYSHTRDRMWRKTRSNPGGRCQGVDPNRNWGFHWNEVGASSNPCDETYAGPYAFSEIETRNIRDFILSQKDRMKAYLSIHAYSQLWLTPWGFTNRVPENYNDLVNKAQIAAKAIASKYGKQFTVGSSTNVLYAAAGGSDDWALGVAGVPYAYTLELRPDENSRSGFVLPAREIIPCGEETWAGVKAFAASLLQ